MIKKVAKVRRKRITAGIAAKVLETVNAGLSSGLGSNTPGSMCVEAAVCYAMGEPHSDRPTCVMEGIRDTKIGLNDWNGWYSLVKGSDGDNNDHKVKKLRADALRRIAIAQLGSKGVIKRQAWDDALRAYILTKPYMRKRVKTYEKEAAAVRKEIALQLVSLEKGDGLCDHDIRSVYALEVNTEGDALFEGVKTASGAKKVCEDLVKILIKLKSPGTKYLYLTEKAKPKKRKAKKVVRKKRVAKK
jgi:hypothetical protein